MTQLSLNTGLTKWINKGRLAVHSEMNQLHMRYMLVPLHRKDLTEEQRNTILEYKIFLKDKRYGTLKGGTVAGGNNQRDFISKEDDRLPTVSTKSFLLTCIIDT